MFQAGTSRAVAHGVHVEKTWIGCFTCSCLRPALTTLFGGARADRMRIQWSGGRSVSCDRLARRSSRTPQEASLFRRSAPRASCAHGCNRGGRRGAYQQATADGFAFQHEFVQVAAFCGQRCGGGFRAHAQHFTILSSPCSVPVDLLWLQILVACARLSVSACVGFGFRIVEGAVT